jgi:high-affinity iron transporter
MWADAVPNLLIGLREGLEGGLVVSILLAAVRRTAPTDSERRISTAPIWLGVLCALTLSLSFGAVLTFYSSALSTRAQEGFGGIASVLAVCLVSGMIFWMRSTARTLSGELRAKVADALRVGTTALALTAFLAVGREGLETALFIWTAVQASGHTVAPLAGAALGIAIAVVLCWLLYKRAVRINLGVFFSRTAVLLIIIAAGVLAYGLGDLQDAGLLPGHTLVAFDISHTVDSGSWWVSIISGVTDLQPTMTWLQVTGYVCYLAAVLTAFLRKPSETTTPAPAAASETTPSTEPARPRLIPRRTVGGIVAAAVAVPAAAAGGLIAFGPKGNATAQRIEVTDSACASGWSTARAGSQSFTVVNKSSHATEINLDEADSGAVVAEIETLGPGTQQTMPATLSDASYVWRCLMSGGSTTSSATVHATGTVGDAAAPPAVLPVSLKDLEPAAAEYRAYVKPKLATLSQQVATLRTAIAKNDMARARADWLPAQLTWEQVGAAYDSFGDIGDAIDGLPNGLPQGVDDPSFTGLHRIEYGLWHGQSSTTLLPIVDKLTGDITTLRGELTKITVDPTDLPIRAHEILEDALRDKISGMSDEGAGAAYPETYADVQGTEVVLTELEPLIDARRPGLVATARQQLAALSDALLATRQHNTWASPANTSQPDREKVDGTLDAVLETLSDVPDLLEVPPSQQ